VISGASDKLIEHKRSFEVYGLCVRERTTAADGRAHGDSQIQKCVSCDIWPPYHSSLSSSILYKQTRINFYDTFIHLLLLVVVVLF